MTFVLKLFFSVFQCRPGVAVSVKVTFINFNKSQCLVLTLSWLEILYSIIIPVKIIAVFVFCCTISCSLRHMTVNTTALQINKNFTSEIRNDQLLIY